MEDKTFFESYIERHASYAFTEEVIEKENSIKNDSKVIVDEYKRQIKLLEKRLTEDANGEGTRNDQRQNETRSLIKSLCLQVITVSMKDAYDLNVLPRLWVTWYDELDAMQTHLKLLKRQSWIQEKHSAHSELQLESKKSELGQYLRRYLLVIHRGMKCFQLLLKACSEYVLQQPCSSFKNLMILRRQKASTDPTVVQSMTHQCLVALGDLSRYQESLKSRDYQKWEVVSKFYKAALSEDFENGKVYNQLGVIAALRQDYFLAVYYYCRSLCTVNPFPSRANLLRLYETFYQKYHRKDHGFSMEAIKKGGVRSVHEMKKHFIETLLVCLRKVFTSISLDDLEHSVTECTHAFSCLVELACQFFLLCEQNDENGTENESFAHFLLQTVVVLMCSLDHHRNIQKKHYSTQEISNTVVDCRDEGSTCLIQLGLIALRILLRASSRYPHTIIQRTLLPGINGLIDWIDMNPRYLQTHEKLLHEIRSHWLDAVSSTCSVTLTADAIPATLSSQGQQWLPEDTEFLGVYSYVSIFEKRFGKDYRALQYENLCTDEARNTQIRMSRLAQFASFMPTNAQENRIELIDQSIQPNVGDAFHPLKSWDISVELHCKLCLNVIEDTEQESCQYCGCNPNLVDQKETQTKRATDHIAMDSTGGTRGARINSFPHQGSDRQTPIVIASEMPRSTSSSLAASSSSSLAAASSSLPLSSLPLAAATATNSNAIMPKPMSITRTWRGCVVLDIPNIAMAHGKHEKFSCQGVAIVCQFYLQRRFKPIGFLPQGLLEYETVGAVKREAKVLGSMQRLKTKLPDDVNLLRKYYQDGYIVPTPLREYDDLYTVQYGVNHQYHVVSNDCYRDVCKRLDDSPAKGKVGKIQRYLMQYRVSFTFIEDEFLPNPVKKHL